MPIFIALGKATDQGLQKLDTLTVRHEEAVKRVARMGGRVISSYATMGRYDFVVTLDCETTETAMAILNDEAAGGNIRYETMVGLPTRDFGELFMPEADLADERKVLRVSRKRANKGARNTSVSKTNARKTSTGARKHASR